MSSANENAMSDLEAENYTQPYPPQSPPQASTDLLREKLAAIEHERWADCQAWCHKILRQELNPNGINNDLEDVLRRWDKQIATPYSELSDREKASDMEQVDRYWPLIQAHIDDVVLAILETLYNNQYTIAFGDFSISVVNAESIKDKMNRFKKETK